MSMMTLDRILNLNEEEFDDELNVALRKLSTFRPFVEFEVVRQTAEYLNNLRDTIDGQLFKYQGISEDPSWAVRTKGFRGLVSSRLHMAQGRIREMEKQEAGSRSSAARAWRKFAHRLAELLDDYDDSILETVDVPFCDLNAGEWLDRRIEKNPLRTGANA